MEKTWKTIENWLLENSATEAVALNEGVTEKEISTLEEILNVKLPTDLISFYKIHNGQKPFADYGLLDFQELLSFERMAEVWLRWNELLNSSATDNISTADPGIKGVWWNPLWIPIAASADGDVVCIDLDPAEGGNMAQIIEVLHEEEERILVGNSFAEWIMAHAQLFERGEMVFSETYGITDIETLRLMEEDTDE